MAASGCAGLGYQIVWTQQGTLWLGHEAAAVLAVVTAFFGGLGLGALTLGPRIARSARPERAYAACEAAIALWCGVLALLAAPVSAGMLLLIGPQPGAGWQALVAFGGTFVLLLPATAAMGATLPAMERLLAQWQRPADSVAATRPGVAIAALYAANTLGAMAGVLLAAFWALPAWGLSATAAACAALNLFCAGAALALGGPPSRAAGALGGQRRGAADCATALAAAVPAAASTAPSLAALARAPALPLLAATGLLGIGHEVLVVRVLSQVAENTVYTFALLLAVYLAGSAFGAAALARGWFGRGDGALLRDRLLWQLAAACALGAASLWAAEWLRDGIGQALQQALGPGVVAPLTAEAALAVAAFALPTVWMGALFSLLCAQAQAPAQAQAQAEPRRQTQSQSQSQSHTPTLTQAPAGRAAGAEGARWAEVATAAQGSNAADTATASNAADAAGTPTGAAGGAGFARALGFNTLGAAAAPPLFGMLLLPWLGAKACLLGLAAGYLVLLSGAGRRQPGAAFTALALAAAALLAPPLVFIDQSEGSRLLSYREGALAAVSVVEDASGVARLRIDNRQQEGSSSSLYADARQAWLPLLLHPAPRRALFLGLGTGMTAGSAATDASLQVDAVELLPEVIAASWHFTRALFGGTAAPALPANLRLLAADARRFVRHGGSSSADSSYDVIVADNFHPARSGSAALYTVEHFRAVGGRLAEGGLFCQWLPLHQLDLTTLRSIVRSFQAAHPGAWALLATNSLETPVLGLLVRRGGTRFDLGEVQRRVQRGLPAALGGPGGLGLDDEFAVLGSVVAGPDALRRLAGNAPLNTDDRPVVATLAPRITYAPDSTPRQRLLELLALLGQTPLQPAAWVSAETDAAQAPSGNAIQAADVAGAGRAASWLPRLAAYLAARQRFLEAGRDIRPAADAQAMLAQVREPLLAVLRISPDFRPAREPLLRLAAALALRDPTAAHALQQEIAQALQRPPGAAFSPPAAGR
jgi:spermidine synthase